MNAPEPDRRDSVRAVLDRYAKVFPADAAVVARIRRLVDDRPDCLLRTCEIGHVTASALVLSPDRSSCLLTHHKKLERWLQLGGHVDGEPQPHRSALREVIEESGFTQLVFFGDEAEPLPFDLDVHSIPARPGEPEHEHHDFRYLLIATAKQTIQVSEESHDVRWFGLDEIAALSEPKDESLARLARRALERLRAKSR